MGVAFFVYHGISRVSLHICAFHTQRGPCRLGVANNTEGTAKYFEQTGLVVYVLVPSYPIAAVGTGVAGRAREWASDLIQQAAPPFPRFPPARVAPPPPHTRGRRGGTPWGSSASQPPVEFRPCPPWVVRSRLGAISRPQIRRWDRRRCRMPDFWVTGRVSSFPNPCQCTLMNENRRIRIGF